MLITAMASCTYQTGFFYAGQKHCFDRAPQVCFQTAGAWQNQSFCTRLRAIRTYYINIWTCHPMYHQLKRELTSR